MRKLFLGLLLLAGTASLSAAPAQPVLIFLYSRFYDHSHPHFTDERLQRLLPLLEKLHEKYPNAGVSALLQFSGTVSEVLYEENAGLHLVDKIKEDASNGFIEVGYTGEDEPSYLYRPKPNLLAAETPEQRWAAKAEAAERFLVDYKNPVTGLPVPGLSGGLKRMQEVFGPAAFVTGVSTYLGSDSPAVSEIRKKAPGALLVGIPPSDPRRGIEGFGFSADNFSKYLSPDPREAPEVFWEDNAVRLSDVSLTDNKPHTTDESLDSLKKIFAALDRSHVRVIKLEVASYKRYITRRSDGSAVTDPMEWLYYHPDEPMIPISLKPFVTQTEIEGGYRRDEATLKWLLEEFLPANPGSRFLSVKELARMAEQTEPGGVSAVSPAQIRGLAEDLERQFDSLPMQLPDFARSGDRFFTLAECFELLAGALAGGHEPVVLRPAYGPLTLPSDMGAVTGSLPVSEVVKVAALLAPRFASTSSRRVPDAAVPALIEAGSLHLNASQFLRLMAQAYLNPSPEKILRVSGLPLTTRAAFMFPKNTPIGDQGNAWTFKPAPLQPAAAVAVLH